MVCALVQLYLKKWWWAVASPGFGVRGHDDRGAEVGWGMGRGVRSPADWKVWGSVVSSPIGVRGGAPTAIEFSAYFRPQNASGSKKNTILLPKVWGKNGIFYMKRVNPLLKVVVTITTTFKSSGDCHHRPSSHTKLRLWVCDMDQLTMSAMELRRSVCFDWNITVWSRR